MKIKMENTRERERVRKKRKSRERERVRKKRKSRERDREGGDWGRLRMEAWKKR